MKKVLAFIRRILGRKYYEYVVFVEGKDGNAEQRGTVYIERKYKIDSSKDFKELLYFIKETNKDIKNLTITNIILINNLI